MVGVELIHPLQLIYYLHFAFKKYSLSISPMQYLSLVTINDLFWSSSHLNLEMFNNFQRADLSIERLQFSYLLLGLPVILFAICSLLYFLIYYFGSEKMQTLSLQIFSKIYSGFFFPCAFGFLFPYILEKATLSTRGNSEKSPILEDTLSLLSLIILAFVSFIMSQELRNLFI